MKKIIALLLTACFILSAAGCASPATSESAEPLTASPEPQQEGLAPLEPEAVLSPVETAKYKIAVITGESASASAMRMAAGVQEFAIMSGMNISMQGTTAADASQQEKLILEKIKEGVNAICIEPIDPKAIDDELKQAKNAGIVVVSHGGEELVNIDYDIEPVRNDMFGAFIMDCLAEAMGEKGEYTIMVSSGSASNENAWADGGVLHQQQVYPEMSLLPDPMRVQAGTDADSAYKKAMEFLPAHPELSGIMCASETAMQGAARAIDELGLTGRVFVSGIGKPADNKAVLESGAAGSIMTWDPALIGKAMCSLAIKLLDGEAIQDHCDLAVAGYNDICLREGSANILEGQAWTVANAANADSFGF